MLKSINITFDMLHIANMGCTASYTCGLSSFSFFFSLFVYYKTIEAVKSLRKGTLQCHSVG